MKVISILNQKGGVGKTTTTQNLAIVLGGMGYRVLTVDLDFQANLTVSLGFQPDSDSYNVADWLIGRGSFDDVIVRDVDENVDLIPSHTSTSRLSLELERDLVDSQFHLRDKLAACGGAYDFVLLDNPADLNIVVVNALVASDYYLMPTLPDHLSILGLSTLEETVLKVQARANPKLKRLGVLLAQYSASESVDVQAGEYLKGLYKDAFFKTRIKRTTRFKQAASFSTAAADYSMPIRLRYEELAREILSRTNVVAPRAGVTH